MRLRDERLAHRQIEPSTVAGADKFDEAIEEFYQDNAKIIQEPLSSANAMAHDPLDAAKVYQRYAAEFGPVCAAKRRKDTRILGPAGSPRPQPPPIMAQPARNSPTHGGKAQGSAEP